MTGPPTIQLSSTSAPPRITYTVTLTYTGPTIDGGGEVDISFTDRLPEEMKNPGIIRADRVSSCMFPDPPPATGGTFTCNTSFNESTRSLTMEIGARPTGAAGTAVNTFEVSNGASTTWSTTILAPPAEPPPSEPPASTSTAPPAVSARPPPRRRRSQTPSRRPTRRSSTASPSRPQRRRFRSRSRGPRAAHSMRPTSR